MPGEPSRFQKNQLRAGFFVPVSHSNEGQHIRRATSGVLNQACRISRVALGELHQLSANGRGLAGDRKFKPIGLIRWLYPQVLSFVWVSSNAMAKVSAWRALTFARLYTCDLCVHPNPLDPLPAPPLANQPPKSPSTVHPKASLHMRFASSAGNGGGRASRSSTNRDCAPPLTACGKPFLIGWAKT